MNQNKQIKIKNLLIDLFVNEAEGEFKISMNPKKIDCLVMIQFVKSRLGKF